jgi:hypothetical protein
MDERPLGGSAKGGLYGGVGSVDVRLLFQRPCSEVSQPLPATLRHARSSGAGPDIRLGAHFGRTTAVAAFSEVDIAISAAPYSQSIAFKQLF